MKTPRLAALSALLALAVNAAWGATGHYQPYADSTGGASQAKGDLLVTPPRASATAEASGAGRYQPHADSTGGSSRLRGELAPESDSGALALARP